MYCVHIIVVAAHLFADVPSLGQKPDETRSGTVEGTSLQAGFRTCTGVVLHDARCVCILHIHIVLGVCALTTATDVLASKTDRDLSTTTSGTSAVDGVPSSQSFLEAVHTAQHTANGNNIVERNPFSEGRAVAGA